MTRAFDEGSSTTPAAGERRSESGELIDRRRVDRSSIDAGGARRSQLLRGSAGHEPRPVAATVVIDDHTLLGDTVVRTLRREGFHADAVQPSSLAAVVERTAELAPTIALLDLDLGSAHFDGLDVIEPLLDLGIHVIALLSSEEPLLVAASVEAGAATVVSKSEPFAVMLEALKVAARGEQARDVRELDQLRRLLRELRGSHAERLAPFRQLSPREREVLTHLMGGRSAESIASASYVSVATVRSQIRAVLTKLGVNSQLGAVAAATTSGWTADEELPMARFSPTLFL